MRRDWLAGLLVAFIFAACPGAAEETAAPDVEVATQALDSTTPTPASPPASSPATAPGFAVEAGDTFDLACPFRDRFAYPPGSITCGLLAVPENREAETSRLIFLHFVHVKAYGDEAGRRDNPIIYLTGGPGAPVDGYVARLRRHPVVASRDLILLEQRGIGASTPFCLHYPDVEPALRDARSITGMLKARAERTKLCFREAAAKGVDLRGYNTVESAHDVKALREALGFEAWNVWGVSYGTLVGQMLMRVDPGGVHAAVLDGMIPNDLEGFGDDQRKYDALLNNAAGLCPAESACDDDLRVQVFAAMTALQDKALTVTPLDQARYDGKAAWLPPYALADIAFFMAYNRRALSAIPAVLQRLSDAVMERDMAVLEPVARFYIAESVSEGVAQGMSQAVQCNDGFLQAKLADLEAGGESPWRDLVYTRAGLEARITACKAAGLAPRAREDYRLLTGGPPTLILNGAWDPVTPPWLAERVHQAMAGSRLVVVPGAGHGPSRTLGTCAADVMTALFDERDVAGLDVSCLEDGASQPEAAGFFRSDAPLRALSLIEGNAGSPVVPALWAGGSAALLLLGVLLVPARSALRVIGSGQVTLLAGPRWAAWSAAVACLAGLFLIAAGFSAAESMSQAALIAGLASPAGLGAWLLLFAGLLAFVAIGLGIRALVSGRRGSSLAVVGPFIIALAAIALVSFAAAWELLPF